MRGGGVKKRPHPSGGVWIFSGITHYWIHIYDLYLIAYFFFCLCLQLACMLKYFDSLIRLLLLLLFACLFVCLFVYMIN